MSGEHGTMTNDSTRLGETDLMLIWAAPIFSDSGIEAISCCALPVQVLVVDFLRSPVPEC